MISKIFLIGSIVLICLCQPSYSQARHGLLFRIIVTDTLTSSNFEQGSNIHSFFIEGGEILPPNDSVVYYYTEDGRHPGWISAFLADLYGDKLEVLVSRLPQAVKYNSACMPKNEIFYEKFRFDDLVCKLQPSSSSSSFFVLVNKVQVETCDTDFLPQNLHYEFRYLKKTIVLTKMPFFEVLTDEEKIDVISRLKRIKGLHFTEL